MDKIKKLFYLFFPLIIGGIISFLISGSIDYTSLNRPPLAPPSWLFPVAWTIIYLLMGISFYIYRKDTNSDEVNKLYYGQLAVNALWSVIFFNLKWYFLAVIWIILLDILVIFLEKKFKMINKISYYLNIPYLIWIIFATYLTIGIWALN